MFLHREADSRLTAVKALFPYYFNSTMFIAHGTGSADFLPIPCNQRKDEGDPRLSSSWAVSSMTQRKILNPTCGLIPNPDLHPHSPRLYPKCSSVLTHAFCFLRKHCCFLLQLHTGWISW